MYTCIYVYIVYTYKYYRNQLKETLVGKYKYTNFDYVPILINILLGSDSIRTSDNIKNRE